MPSEKVKSPGNWIIPFICRHDAVQGGQGGVLPPPPLTSPRPEPGRGLWAQRASAGRCMPALLSLTCLVSDRPWGPSPRPELGGGAAGEWAPCTPTVPSFVTLSANVPSRQVYSHIQVTAGGGGCPATEGKLGSPRSARPSTLSVTSPLPMLSLSPRAPAEAEQPSDFWRWGLPGPHPVPHAQSRDYWP